MDILTVFYEIDEFCQQAGNHLAAETTLCREAEKKPPVSVERFRGDDDSGSFSSLWFP